ncbi:MAG: thioredoxin [Candidatus Cloacimonetes bacterium]|nr:thioredoxin [Candidatus Cloacimonadota bacterium]
MALKELKTAEFDSSIKEGVSIVDFWAPWCGPCRMVTPILEEMATEMPEVKFYKINVDEEQTIAARFGIMSIPTLIIFKDGEIKDTAIGVMPKKTIKTKLEAV